MLDLSTVIHLEKNLVVTDLSGEKVMVDFATSKYYLLEGPANEIWDYISTDITFGEIIDRLLTIYNIDRETCQTSTEAFLQNLIDNKIISLH